MSKRIAGFALSVLLLALCLRAEAQQQAPYRVGVLVPGEAWYEIIDGLRVGLKQLGFEEGKPTELQSAVRALRAGEVDAYLAVSDAIASNQAQLIIDTARVKRLPTMFDFLSHVAKGGLASYAVSFHEMGRLSAKYVQRILTGVRPNEMPVEGVDKISLVINLKAAKQIGLTIPPNVLARADKVIK